MYIAFKWLLSMSLAMWLTMCITNKTEKHTKLRQPDIKSLAQRFTFKNTSDQNNIFKTVHTMDNNSHSYPDSKEHNRSANVQLLMFVAGVVAVSLFIKNHGDLIGGIRTVLRSYSALDCVARFKYRGLLYGAAISKYFLRIWEDIKTNGYTMKTIIGSYAKRTTKTFKEKLLYNIMLNKLQDIVEERKSLGRLLVTAIQENKKIRTQYHLENLAKNRLAQHIENINKQIKDHRSRYTTFQHIYLLTHQENMFLKSRIRKLTKEIEEAQRDIVGLINEVYKTENRDLKLYCSQYLIKTKKSSSHSMNSEIQIFMSKIQNKSSATKTSTPCQSNLIRDEIPSPASFPLCGTEISQNKDLVPLRDLPKLKGLPGEYVWTVKDKDGMIEKLYEYDYEPGYDNGETVKKIREYSVYYDKDCLLDFSKVFGKVYPLPRQQVAYGDEGITYKYSGTTVPALPWPAPVLALHDLLFKLKGIKYDFVLVNKYRDGNDHMGEHRDNEPELDPEFPIASISFGQERHFVLKHRDARKPGHNRKLHPPVIMKLENGSILFMNPPTNEMWYHSLPTRKKLPGARINLTFRKMRKKY